MRSLLLILMPTFCKMKLVDAKPPAKHIRNKVIRDNYKCILGSVFGAVFSSLAVVHMYQSPPSTPTFIEAKYKDSRHSYIATNKIRWMQENKKCFEVCIKDDGCLENMLWNVCRDESPKSYEYIQQHVLESKETP